jgi:hypothetical protein
MPGEQWLTDRSHADRRARCRVTIPGVRGGRAPGVGRIAGGALAVGLSAAVLVALSGCSSSSPSASAVPKTVKEGAGAVGAACYYLTQAEKYPVGSAKATLGSFLLAHAQSLSFTAQHYDKRWNDFVADMQQIGQPNGQPALDRVSAVCKKWAADPNYYTTHMPPS